MDLDNGSSEDTASTSGTSTAVSLFVMLISIIILLKFYGHGGNTASKYKNKRKFQRKIPIVSHFPVKLPSVVEGMYSLYKFRRDGLKFWEEMQSKYGDIFEIPMAHKKFTCVFDPSAAQKILMSSNPEHLSKNNFVYDTIFVKEVKDGLVSSDYDIWSIHRKILSRSFTYKSLQTYLPFMNTHGKSLVSHLKSLCIAETKNSVSGRHIHDTIWSETMQIIAQSVVGEDIYKDGGHKKMHGALKTMKTSVQYRLGNPYLLLNPIWNLHPMKKELDKAIHYCVGMMQMAIDNFKKGMEEGRIAESSLNEEDAEVGVKAFRSLLGELLYSGASEKEVMSEVITFGVAGHETVTIAASMLLFHLACNPNCQKLCREEVDQLFSSIGSENENDYNLTMDDLANFKYLERAILEGLRLSSSIPVFIRYLGAPLEIDESLTLDADSIIFFSPWCMHRDPKSFPDPTKFDPDRFLPENLKTRHLGAYMPFSIGARNCIGHKYAMMEIKIILAFILRQFEIFTTDKPEDIEYSMEVTLLPDREINIILKNRNDVSCHITDCY